MFSHVMVGVSDLDKAKAFYDATLGALGVAPGFVDRHRVFWRTPAGVFAASLPINGDPATFGNGSTVGFACASPEQADAWHAAGVASGGVTCEEPPGVREKSPARGGPSCQSGKKQETTRSPVLNDATPSPTASTSPAPSAIGILPSSAGIQPATTP